MNQEESNDVFDRIRATETVRRLATFGIEKWHAVERGLGRIFVVQLLIRTFREMTTDDSTHMAAGVSFYAFMSLFPLLLGATAILSFFVDPNDVETSISSFSEQYIFGSAELVTTNLRSSFDFEARLESLR